MLPLAPVQFPHTIPNVVPRGTYVFPVVDASADLARDERALETRRSATRRPRLNRLIGQRTFRDVTRRLNVRQEDDEESSQEEEEFPHPRGGATSSPSETSDEDDDDDSE